MPPSAIAISSTLIAAAGTRSSPAGPWLDVAAQPPLL
jgi:hypothetical protein